MTGEQFLVGVFAVVAALLGWGKASGRRRRAAEEPISEPIYRPPPRHAPPRAEEDLADWMDESCIRGGLSLPAWIAYIDGGGVPTDRQITIRTMHGGRDETGKAYVDAVVAWCHLRQAERTFVPSRIQALRESPDAVPIQDEEDIGTWLRCMGGMAHHSDRGWRERIRERAAEMAEEQRIEALADGVEHRVEPTPIAITSTRADQPGATIEEEVLLLGYDTDPTGAPTVLLIAKSRTAKRGRPIFITETRHAGERLLASLRLGGRDIAPAEVSGWVQSLPPRADHG
jgi:hypothetical protein